MTVYSGRWNGVTAPDGVLLSAPVWLRIAGASR